MNAFILDEMTTALRLYLDAHGESVDNVEDYQDLKNIYIARHGNISDFIEAYMNA